MVEVSRLQERTVNTPKVSRITFDRNLRREKGALCSANLIVHLSAAAII
jgi:hypothetical protein